MNYDVYEVEIDTGIPGYRLLQHIKAIDPSDAQAKVIAAQSTQKVAATARAVLLQRPCTLAEVADAIEAGIVPEGTVPTDLKDVPAEAMTPDLQAKVEALDIAAGQVKP